MSQIINVLLRELSVQQNYKTLRYLNPVKLGSIADRDMDTEAKALDRVQADAFRLFVNMFPDACYELISDWERVYGLTPDIGSSTGVRVAALLAKIRGRGGLSRPFFINLAQTLGFSIEIEEPTGFMAGLSGAGDVLFGEDFSFVWYVNVLNAQIPTYLFYAGSNGAGDRLCDFGAVELESVFVDLKPADTLVFFEYPNFTEE